MKKLAFLTSLILIVFLMVGCAMLQMGSPEGTLEKAFKNAVYDPEQGYSSLGHYDKENRILTLFFMKGEDDWWVNQFLFKDNLWFTIMVNGENYTKRRLKFQRVSWREDINSLWFWGLRPGPMESTSKEEALAWLESLFEDMLKNPQSIHVVGKQAAIHLGLIGGLKQQPTTIL